MGSALRTLCADAAFRLCLVLWCFGYLLVDIGATAQGRGPFGLTLTTNIPLLALGVAQSLGLAGVMQRLGARHGLLQWPAIAVAVVIAGMVQTLADFLWLRMLALTLFPAWQEWALNTEPSRVFSIYLLYTWTMALSVALIWSARIGDIARLNEARAAAFEAAASRAEAAALRLQLNPHFLFNTLNGIASLVVRRKSDQAEEMIGRLADFLRSSLAADPTALIPLSQELTTVRSYLHIEEARFGDRMRVVYRIEEDALKEPVPNFLLQPLIENAVKYGVGASRSGAELQVEAKTREGSLILSVTNYEVGAEPPRRSEAGPSEKNGIGLTNTRRRLETLYGDRAWVTTKALGRASYHCEIGLPLSVTPAIMAAAE